MKLKLVFLSILLTGIAWIGSVSSASEQTNVITAALERKVVLQRVYLDGEMSEETHTESILAMEDFWAEYVGWELVDQNNERIVLKKNEPDISPLLKSNGFFGISEDGIFSIFNGKPEEQKIIQSFFQLDIEKLEVKEQEELVHGIPILNKNQYEKVLEAYKSYSLPYNKK
ncbi:intercompartmental signaling factor BofC [Bacillus cihuensis]|uniref:intercompartmental signaling factor BofC n=1 Tax=Bacillus cihuensis TaxID=1208599 RepID=UPI000408510A|nr:intercompartmental signaling factor BofC [Bacillus cihuensis]